MNESMVTFQGWLGGDVRTQQAGGVLVAKFRVASTPRRLNRATGEWHDGPTQWYSVSAWRALGEHCAESLRRGDPVVVHGRLTQATWVNQEGVEMTSLEVDASFVGHDLSRGTSDFTRRGGRRAVEPENEAPAGAAAGEEAPAVPQVAPAPEPRHWVA
jgi:single-strand DNA-binding protein